MKADIKLIKKLCQKQRRLIIGLLILLILLIVIFWFIFIPQIKLNGKDIVRVEINTKYKELGASAYVNLKEIKGVKISGKVNTSKLGKYKIKYTVKYHSKTYSKTRTVIVEDTQPPVITLNGDKKTNVCSINKYIDEGATAIDNLDGDLTDKIKVTKNDNKIIYSVKDKSGNKTTLVRKLIVKDDKAPELTLNGDAYVYTYVGNSYKDEGATANDNCEGDLTSNIVVTGLDSVDTNTQGEYEITYEVADSSGNTNKIERIVKVVPKPSNERVIYLTFDDGPSYTVTGAILDILKEENVKATFFVINHSDDLNYLIKREYDEGHTVALHSYTHNYGQIYTSVDAYFEDLEAIKNKVKSITGVDANIIRFPGGSSNTVSSFNPGIMTTLASEVGNRGYIYFDWNISCGDAGGAQSASDVYNNVISELNDKTNIVLMHDFESNYKTLNALRDIITYAKNNGYTFDRITSATPKIRHGINN